MSKIIIDCEASSLNDDSYPIQIAWVDLETDQHDSFYIRPDPTWDDWDEYAEHQIHGLSRSFIEHNGLPLQKACERLLNTFKQGDMLFSDAPDYDSFWLNRLMETAWFLDVEWEVFSVFDLFEDLPSKNHFSIELDKDNRSHDALDDCHSIKNAYYLTINDN